MRIQATMQGSVLLRMAHGQAQWSAAQLAGALSISLDAVSRSLAGLRERGCAERRVVLGADEHALWELTEAGRTEARIVAAADPPTIAVVVVCARVADVVSTRNGLRARLAVTAAPRDASGLADRAREA